MPRKKAAQQARRTGRRDAKARHDPGPPQALPPVTLLDPKVAEFMRRLATGEIPETDSHLPWTLTSAPGTVRALIPFLQSSGDFTKLADALKTTPSLLWHPIVYAVIWHLREVRRKAHDERPAAQAEQILIRLTQALASGLLGKGWSVQRPKRVPGRRAVDPSEALTLRDDVEWLSDALKNDLKKHSGESISDWINRAADVVVDIWEKSPISMEIVSREAVRDFTVEDALDLYSLPINYTQIPPPSKEELVRWVREAADRQPEGRSVHLQIALRLVGHRAGLSADQVRGRIDTVSKWRRDLGGT